MQELQARYSAFAFFKRVFNKKVRLELKNHHERVQQERAKQAAGAAITKIVESYEGKEVPENIVHSLL